MKKRKTIKSYMSRVVDVYRDKKVKTLIDFDRQQTNSIKSLALKKNKNVKLTT